MQKEIELEEEEKNEDCHLRSVNEVTGYEIEATDGSIGHVEDFIVEDNWAVRYMVVDTKNWWPGKKVLVSPDWIKNVSFNEQSVKVDLTKESIKNGPEYNPDDAPLSRSFINLVRFQSLSYV
jgi:hypothetical protein